MRRRLIVPTLIFLLALAAFWWLRARPRSLPEAYVIERSATLWSSLAQVKQPVATLHYGQKVAVLQRRREQVEIRTAEGVGGWLEARLLMEPALWQRSGQLLVRARAMPVQARGRTKVLSNLRVEPGRAAARVYQFGRGMPVEVLSRAVAEWSAPAEANQPAAKEVSAEEQKPRREDWRLVRGVASSGVGPGGFESVRGEESSVSAKPEESVPVAGWVLARFVELELPGPVRDYASSSGMRVVAWFDLNGVADPTGEKPRYLAAGVRGSEGQPCDFTMIRVYTWGARRKRYETAYLESNFCGQMPVRVAQSAAGPEFRFATADSAKNGERLYRMRQTVVRRVREAEHAGSRPSR
jgi:hypothetical protein